MKKLLIFGGAGETKDLLRELEGRQIKVTVCVASDYGRRLLPGDSEKLSVLVGRRDRGQILSLIRSERPFAVVDATHPYAAEATKNIKAAAGEAGVPYLRLLREPSDLQGALIVSSAQEAAGHLAEMPGNVLLTTGSKELEPYALVPGLKERLYVRVLPAEESIRACLTCGIPAGHIIAMQGPFSRELNAAIIRQYCIAALVTKDGGERGGFAEKLTAARETGAKIIVIRRPEDSGMPLPEVVRRALELAGEAI